VDVRLLRGCDLAVVRRRVRRIAGVLAREVDDRRVVARGGEAPACRERACVGLHLQVALVREPVADVGDERREEDDHRQPEDDHHEHAAVRAAAGPEDVGPAHEHPAP